MSVKLQDTYNDYTSKSGVTVTPPISNTSSAVTGSTNNPVVSSIENTRKLYESGLQNIFNDYQRSIATLNTAKQKEIEDAYFIREMSKKYLGEYSSDNNIGNVSGNLVDIYANYQKSLGDIEKNSNELELNLQQEYGNQRLETFNNILKAQYDLDVAQMESNAQRIVTDIQMGNTNGMSEMEYLESQKSVLSETDYNTLKSTLYSQVLQEVQANIEGGYYGYDAQGKRIETAQDYLQYAKTKYSLSERDFNDLETQVKWMDEINKQNTPPQVYSYRDMYNVDGTKNTHYNADFDASYNYSGSYQIDANAPVFQFEGDENEYAQVAVPVDDEENSYMPVSSTDISDNYIEKNPDGVLAKGQIHYYGSDYFRFDGEKWYRLANIGNSSQIAQTANTQMKNWYAPASSGSQDAQSSDGAFKTNGGSADTLFFNGITYVEDNKNILSFKPSDSNLTEKEQALVNLFKTTHPSGNNIRKYSVVYFEGKFWEYNDSGKIVPMIKKVEETEE